MGPDPQPFLGQHRHPRCIPLRGPRGGNQVQAGWQPERLVRNERIPLYTGRGTMSAIVEIRELSKQFGRRKAVDDVSMTIESGEIFGLVGPNGAGKTTTMRMLVTLLQPDKGEIHVGGYSVRKAPREVRRQIGF